MRIAVIGGGPAGLVFATLCRRLVPSCVVEVLERSEHGSVEGFGVGFFEGALDAFFHSFPELWPSLRQAAVRSERISLLYRNGRRSLEGRPFFAIGRARLIAVLRSFAVEAGARIVNGRDVTVDEALFGYDLVVGADGINSLVRERWQNAFLPTVKECRNKWLWKATTARSKNVELIFKCRPEGVFIGHTYPFDQELNTFIVECTPEAWKGAGLEEMSAQARLRYCEFVFADFLQGKGFVPGRSEWFSPRVIMPGRWSTENVTLIGDALKTLHPSIGSGTKAAMEDAAALASAIGSNSGYVSAALQTYEAHRKPDVARLQNSAIKSIDWYESLTADTYDTVDALSTAFAMRTGRVKADKVTLAVERYTTL